MSDADETTPVFPHYAQRENLLAWVASDIWDHLWPWSRRGFRRQRFLLALSVAAAVVIAIVWLLGAAGRIGAPVVIAWWVGWSVFEVMVRMQSKPYVKDGPWWGRRYRTANLMDMICYVSFKNVLLGSLLYIAMRLLGVLDLLQSMPSLRWLYQ